MLITITYIWLASDNDLTYSLHVPSIIIHNISIAYPELPNQTWELCPWVPEVQLWILIGSSITEIPNWSYKRQKTKGTNELLASCQHEAMSAFGQPQNVGQPRKWGDNSGIYVGNYEKWGKFMSSANGSSFYCYWFRKRASSASIYSHVCIQYANTFCSPLLLLYLCNIVTLLLWYLP
jgi:hypothetical protein